ncbi:MAG: MotA/TolQ/ExbB proton channel family protein [Planctomycetota bacterium]
MEAALDALRRSFEIGGWVMLPLAALSAGALAIVVERALFWARLTGPATRKLVRELAARLREGGHERAIDATAERGDPYSRLARDLAGHGRRGGVGEVVAREAIEAQRGAIERFQGMLSIIITAAPMLGILGTVTGIITSFQAIGGLAGDGMGSEGGGATDPRLIAGGIAQALYTTAFGLGIAIATLFPYALFKGLADRALTRLELLGASAMEGFGPPKSS